MGLAMPIVDVKFDKEGKIVSLPWSCRFDNFLMAGAWPITMLAAAQWTLNTWRAQYRQWKKNGSKGLFIPQMPHRMMIFNRLTGLSCAEAREYLRQFGISSQMLSLQFALWPDQKGIGLHCSYLVPGPQWEMADAIAYQYSDSFYDVLSKPGGKRRYRFTRPWGVPAKRRSWDEVLANAIFGWAINRKAIKLRIEEEAKKKEEVVQGSKKKHGKARRRTWLRWLTA